MIQLPASDLQFSAVPSAPGIFLGAAEMMAHPVKEITDKVLRMERKNTAYKLLYIRYRMPSNTSYIY